MDHGSHKRVRRQFASWFWILLIYVIAALVWWFISLEKQNREMSELRINQLVQGSGAYKQKLSEIRLQQERNTTKYISEGVTFLLLILIGAVIVYRAIRKQMEYVSLQRNFMMAVTHELKTPIATTQLSLETLLYRNVAEEQQKKLIRQALAETGRLNRLTSNILLTAQMEEKSYRPVQEHLSLSDLVKSVVSDYQRRHPERVINTKIGEDLTMQGDSFLLEMAISNLIDNALKYTPGEKPVEVELRQEADQLIFKVTDQGAGISPADKARIFDKFYRSEDEQIRKSKGSGLGLYLTAKIASLHKGRVFVEDHLPTGSIFILQF